LSPFTSDDENAAKPRKSNQTVKCQIINFVELCAIEANGAGDNKPANE